MADQKKILVTGANGQLGKELQQLCGSYPQFDFVFVARDDMPIDNFQLVRNTFKGIQPAYCINCAAYTAVDKAESESELAFLINAEAAGMLAEICKEYNCALIHISTDYVFDGRASTPYKVDAETNPQGVYGASKLEGEKRVLEKNPDAIIIRTSWVYSEFGKNFVKTMLRLMNERTELNVVNDQIGSPTYAYDLADAILKIISSNKLSSTPHASRLMPHDSLYHFSNSGTISWYDFALAIKELSESDCNIHPISTDQYPTAAKRPAYSVLDNSKFISDFGIEQKDWKESLETCIKRIKTQQGSRN